MAEKSFDVVVLGAGIVGVATALQLQKRGRSVALVERHAGAAEETSFGNTGIIERASIEPYMFPRGFASVLAHAFNRCTDARYHLAALPHVAPWLWRYFRASAPASAARIARAALPLIERCLVEHEALMQDAGATHLLRKVGWIKLFRSDKGRRAALDHARIVREHGLGAEMLDVFALRALEPSIGGVLGGVHYPDPGLISDPEALGKAYAAHFVASGGVMPCGDARGLETSPDGFRDRKSVV